MMSPNLNFLLTAFGLLADSPVIKARKPMSYRYGELASFESDMMAMRQEQIPDVWVHLPLDKSMMPMSYKYGKKSGTRKPISHGRRKLVNDGPMSYKYGAKSMSMPSMKMSIDKVNNNRMEARPRNKMAHGMARGQPLSYRYGQKHTKMAGKNMTRHTGKPHPPFKGNKRVMSYQYGKKFMKKDNGKAGIMLNMAKAPTVNDVMAFRDMPMMGAKDSEMDMVIKPLRNVVAGMKPKVKRSSEKMVQFYEDKDGTVLKAEQDMDILDIDLGPELKQKVINVWAFDGKASFIEGELMVLSNEEKSIDSLRPFFQGNMSNMKSQSFDDIQDKFDGLKDRINLSNEWVRLGVSVFLGFFMTLFMIVFFKTLFRLWTKLGRHRREDEENRELLKGELDSIHPISIVYKN